MAGGDNETKFRERAMFGMTVIAIVFGVGAGWASLNATNAAQDAKISALQTQQQVTEQRVETHAQQLQSQDRRTVEALHKMELKIDRLLLAVDPKGTRSTP